MPQRRSHVAPSAEQSELAAALAQLRAGIESPVDFSPEALAEAKSVMPKTPSLDLRDVPFVTLDPAGSKDLDQAMHLSKAGSAYQVRYAIADVPSFVVAGGALDAEARKRGQTLYLADGNVPLHPRELSEGRASLLADQERPALVWTFTLDSDGMVKEFRLERALVRSRAQLDYVAAQKSLDAGEDGPLSLLPVIGALRQELEAQRGGASLNLPDEEVVQKPDGTYGIERRHPLPIEDWNAQLSLMTGMAAAELMVGAKVGVLRTMPQPDEEAFARFRRQTEALGRPWTTGRYGEYLRNLDKADPMTLPVLEQAVSLFRGAGYITFDGSVPAGDLEQAAIGAPYAHATAPLRRLVDRWSLAICLAISEGKPAPDWARESLPELPELMQQAAQRASELNAETINRVEAALLHPLVGKKIDATLIEVRGEERAAVQIAEPAVTASAKVPEGTRPGETVTLTLESVDVAKGQVMLVA
ncbi:RNB domain-containing ribonuclease [uncultured Microbacterium sp.]|mgnify:CR=1 FL=1|uniref:RNB domain-containing ribonuclease n=1 Tax=uncultured Microbacterium sp. TaxID=191216 RepID=UPI0026097E1F|nr:RNB domain-containing ribonuclease [uncultured Microbacterium sp.]